MPKLGQHFLKNRRALALMARALDVRDGETVIEIGPGHGELTEELKAQNSKLKDKNQGVKIIAIEKDLRLAEFLRKRFSEEPQIKILEGDALEIIPDLGSKLLRGGVPLKLAGNIPYYLTGKLLRVIGELTQPPVISVFTIQKEVAERITADPPRMNRLAASIGFWAKAQIILRLPRTDFAPPPDVDSAIIQLNALSAPIDANRERYYRAVHALFSQPRKTILNNLAGEKAHSKEELIKKLRDINLRPDLRPQNLTLKDIVRITHML